MIITVDDLKLTDEQIAQYIAMVNEHGKERLKNFDVKDSCAFALGAAVLFFATGQQDKIPASWVFAPMMGKSPFVSDKMKIDA